MVNGEPDAELVARCLAGETQAFEPLVRRYQRVLYNVALRMVGNPEDAQDVAQVAFVKAWERLGTFDPRYRFFSWLYKIVVNESINARTRRPPTLALEVEVPAEGGPEDALRSHERAGVVDEALRRLSADHRLVVVLRHFAELSYTELADVLDLPEKTVKSRLHEARQRLGRMLEPVDLQ
jgi:RNA polymerase sigma-70 factor (ECF subfamily)